MITRIVPSVALLGVIAFASTATAGNEFTYSPPGVLTPGSGTGRMDNTVYAPGMRFPIETGPAFANSQVWGNGGSEGPGGSQCDVENFSYPWWDNYCETRSWDMPLCPSGVGHQGQDIRASSCEKNVHWVVASEAGTVTNVGSYSVYITAADGTRYDYLHMGSVQVAVGQDVAKGEHIGKVSNEFGGTATTVHLHFNLRQNVENVGTVYVPTYLSLVTSYQALIGPPVEPAQGALDDVTCDTIGGYAISPGAPDIAIEARLYFDGEKGDGATVGHPILADFERADCGAAGACENGFEVGPPLSLFDGLDHAVRGYASDGTSAAPELGGSPKTMKCSFELPEGVRRKISGEDAKAAWKLSTFWDEVSVSAGVLGSLSEGAALGDKPRVLVSATDPSKLWIVDGSVRRPAIDVRSARAWDLSAIGAEAMTDAELSAIPEGAPLRARPIVLRGPEGDLWLVDDADVTTPQGAGAGDGVGPDGGAPDGDDEGCDCSTPGGSAYVSGQAKAPWLLFGLALMIGSRARARRRAR